MSWERSRNKDRAWNELCSASWIIEGPVVWRWVASCVICHPGAVLQWLSCSAHTQYLMDGRLGCWCCAAIYYSHTLTLQVLPYWCLVHNTDPLGQLWSTAAACVSTAGSHCTSVSKSAFMLLSSTRVRGSMFECAWMHLWACVHTSSGPRQTLTWWI